MAIIRYEIIVYDGDHGDINMYIDGKLKVTGVVDELDNDWTGNKMKILYMESTVEHVYEQ